MVSRVPNGVFTGRETNLQIIKDAVKVHLQADLGLHPRCFVISGIGGAGKSELCLRTVLDLRSKYATMNFLRAANTDLQGFGAFSG